MGSQHILNWILEAISIAYKNKWLDLPAGMRAHSTRVMATSRALFRALSVEDICAGAGWASPHKFVRIYRLDVTTATMAQSVLTAGF